MAQRLRGPGSAITPLERSQREVGAVLKTAMSNRKPGQGHAGETVEFRSVSQPIS